MKKYCIQNKKLYNTILFLKGFSWHNNGKQQFENSGSSSFYVSKKFILITFKKCFI